VRENVAALAVVVAPSSSSDVAVVVAAAAAADDAAAVAGQHYQRDRSSAMLSVIEYIRKTYRISCILRIQLKALLKTNGN